MRDRTTRDRKTAILEAAARVIAQRGVRGLRIEQLAGEAGVSKALVYYHFGDRARLLRHTLALVGERAERYTRGPAGPDAGRDRLRELEDRLLLEFRDAPAVRENSTVWGELRAGAVFEPELREGLARASREWTEEVAGLLGRVAPGAPHERLTGAAERLTVLVEGLSTRWLIGVLPVGHAVELLREAVAAEAGALRRADDATPTPLCVFD
ncbi:TetR/AcrR family transcriptional regulator [Streptomyces sp. NPDC001941]|uniref:TetR/AcrR family transcriptional regulator n=1 Tax=Streptomyces sp. NPDC001941 TaxID=3154659 RepID=UPI0033285A4B